MKRIVQSPMRALLRGLVLVAGGLGVASIAGNGSAAAPDPAARGLDAFLSLPAQAFGGSTVALSIETFGFPTTVNPVPLAGVTIEAAWDPASLGSSPSSPLPVAPPSVKVVSERGGTATLVVPVPDGESRNLDLLVGLRFGEHSRTRTLKIARRAPQAIAIHVQDTHVVPGTTIPVWAHAQSNVDGKPLAGTKVHFHLVEGAYRRHELDAVTDRSGWAMARIPIPPNDDPTWSWELYAALEGVRTVGAKVDLVPRDETPGEPQARADFDERSVEPGKSATYRIVARDGSGSPIANHAVRVWTGPTGTKAPASDAEWEGVSTVLTTDPSGVAKGALQVPTLTSGGARMELRARLVFEGKALGPATSIGIGVRKGTIGVTPEDGALVPGMAQSLFVRLRDDHDKPITGELAVDGDGLHDKLVTDEHGEGEVHWTVPKDVGAQRDVGPCASGVAATIRFTPKAPIAALGAGPFLECVPVDRERTALLRVDRPMVRVGGAVTASLNVADASSPTSFTVTPSSGADVSTWAAFGAASAKLTLGSGGAGVWSVSATRPRTDAAAKTASAALLVLPKVLPRLTVRTTSVRAVPDGEAVVEASLDDGKGTPLSGSGQAILVDLEGGGSLDGIESLDARQNLCASVAIERERCEAFLGDDPGLDPSRRWVLFGRGRAPKEPTFDPGGTAKHDLDAAFSEVLHSLEGALYEATSSPTRLVDVKRKGPGGAFVFNPELLTLTTAAMSSPPTTPGGEAITLPDLLAIDPQVTFDNVARRVTRLKLFRVLTAVRSYKRDNQLDDDEPLWKDPNALLRRLVRTGLLDSSALLDPWGGTMEFVSGNSGLPFVGVVRGFTLASPGPDGKLGTGDDLRDPFARVVRSKTPYAIAMNEDALVDAKYDMQVSDATVDAWKTTLESATGTALGDVTSHGSGTGTGQGFGSGHGRLMGGSTRVTPSMFAHSWISERVRFDAAGKASFKVPLGSIETKWGIAVLADADDGEVASASLSVPVALPLSVSVDSGGSWTEGDHVAARLVVRNRTAAPVHATVELSAKDAVALDAPSDARFVVDVPAGGLVGHVVGLRAITSGTASLTATVSAANAPSDSVLGTWQVSPAGEEWTTTRASWISAAGTLEAEVPPSSRLTGAPSLVLERGLGRSIDLALGALDPDRLAAPGDLLAAVIGATRVVRFATANEPATSPRLARAKELLARARARFVAVQAKLHGVFGLQAIYARELELVAPTPGLVPVATADRCPPSAELHLDELDVAAAEPAPEATGALPCWDSFVAETVRHVTSYGSAADVARLYLVLVDRAHRVAQAKALLGELVRAAHIDATGAISIPSGDRRDRAEVYAALVRGGGDAAAPALRPKLVGWLLTHRDAGGSYGSAKLTADALAALTSVDTLAKERSNVRVRAAGVARDAELGDGDVVTIPLAVGETRAQIEVRGAPVFASLVRPLLRPFSAPGELVPSPLAIHVTWPEGAAVGKNLLLHVELSEATTSKVPITLRARIPLPPGVTLSAPVAGVRQVGGAILLETDLTRKSSLDIPIRFGLGGSMSTREPQVFAPVLGAPRGVAPAQTLVVK